MSGSGAEKSLEEELSVVEDVEEEDIVFHIISKLGGHARKRSFRAARDVVINDIIAQLPYEELAPGRTIDHLKVNLWCSDAEVCLNRNATLRESGIAGDTIFRIGMWKRQCTKKVALLDQGEKLRKELQKKGKLEDDDLDEDKVERRMFIIEAPVAAGKESKAAKVVGKLKRGDGGAVGEGGGEDTGSEKKAAASKEKVKFSREKALPSNVPVEGFSDGEETTGGEGSAGAARGGGGLTEVSGGIGGGSGGGRGSSKSGISRSGRSGKCGSDSVAGVSDVMNAGGVMAPERGSGGKRRSARLRNVHKGEDFGEVEELSDAADDDNGSNVSGCVEL